MSPVVKKANHRGHRGAQGKTKKPDAFALPNDPMDPKVDRGVSIIAGDPKMIPPPMKLVLAGLAFANSDLAFQGKYLFQGNFYGVNIYDVADPSKAKLE